MKKLYLECNTGISGDMFVAALLDLGVKEEKLRQVLNTVPEKHFEVAIKRVKKSGLDCLDFDVILEQEYDNHDHDMQYLYGAMNQEAEKLHGVENQNENHHNHHHNHSHASTELNEHHSIHTQHHVHRGMKEVFTIIEQTDMSEAAKNIAKHIFVVLGKAEAKAHGETLETVHFHEVGAIDSIVDIISAAFCLDELGVSEVIVPEIYEGTGTVRCAHGILPIPVPAVLNIVAEHGIALHVTDRKGELVTPTGAAIIAAIRTSDKLPNRYVVKGIGLGAGKRAYEQASILRAMLIEEAQTPTLKDTIYKLETNLDDCTGENLGFIMEKLMKAGAKDVNYTPVFMKKNRPAYLLTIICDQDQVEQMEELVFEHTTSIGIRRCEMERTILPRKVIDFSTTYGIVKIKVCETKTGRKYYPEYESVAKLAEEHKISYTQMFANIIHLLQCQQGDE